MDEAVQRRTKFTEAMSEDNKWITLMKSVSGATKLTQELVDESVELVKIHDGGDVELVILNEMYARDISKKVRSSHRLRGNSGEPLSQPPYGYMKSPENKKKWIIDPEAAEVVNSIFKMCLEGKGNETIARMLQEQKVLVPMTYWQSKGLNRGGKKTQPNPYRWCKTTIQKILSQQEYCGDVINFKTFLKSFKNKTRLENDPENWAVFKDVYEPIIDRDTFEKVQKLISETKRRAPKSQNGAKSIFCDLLYCEDCHKKLLNRTNTINKDIHYFVCSNNKVDYRGTCEGRHYVRADAVEQVVKLELRRMANFLRDNEQEFAEILAQKTNAEMLKEKKHNEANFKKRSFETIRFYGFTRNCMRTMLWVRSATSGLCSYPTSMRLSVWN